MKRFFYLSVFLCFFLAATSAYPLYAQKIAVYRNVAEREIEITTDILNIRTGPGTDYPVVGTVSRGEILEVIGTLDNWYIVLTSNNSIGVISSKYTKVITMDEIMPQNTPSFGADDNNFAEPETEAEKLFQLVNQSRVENNLPPFEWDEKIHRIAQIKAEDMANNKYFDHQSPNYGTPFTMLKQMGVMYKTASENIARNNSVENAHLEIMASLHHRVNVLNSRYNKMGIGIIDSEDWGKIIVELFIEE